MPDKGTIDRECAPLDYGPGSEAKDDVNHYWVWDFANRAGANPLGLVSGQIVSLGVLGKTFNPGALKSDAPVQKRHQTSPSRPVGL